MKRINVFMEEELHSKAKIAAVLRKKSLQKYFEEAIIKSVSKDKKMIEKLMK